jgi:cytochrome c biogenesis protein CcdA/thiol-disulfide isomerase/thioredoxin
MLIFLLAYIGGALTILSPCILPVLPFVFARSGEPFVKSGLPMLLGMALMFAGVATLAAVGGGWAVQANQYGRIAAIVLLGLFGLTLLFPAFADRVMHPIVSLGNRVLKSAEPVKGKARSPVVTSFLLGIATGLLWAPCAGPILGLLLTGAALNGANTHTTLLLLAYALGAATSLAAALLIGGRVFAAMKNSLGVGEWIRRGLGVAVLAGVVAIAFGLDTGLLTKLSLTRTASIEQSLLDKIHPAAAMSGAAPVQPTATTSPTPMQLPVEGTLPELTGAVQWLNSPPLTRAGLRGKVVLVDFWTYSCINCLRSLPYVSAWAQKYKDQGLVVIGVHAPEFAFEKDIPNVQKAVHDLGVSYPVAIDNDFAIWRAFNNQYWPAHYFIDAKGQIRHHHYGEGEYQQSEQVIQQLLAEAGHKTMPTGFVQAASQGVGAAANDVEIKSPETYIGYSRADHFISNGGQTQDVARVYSMPDVLKLNDWGLTGNWRVEKEKAVLVDHGGHIRFRFHARDLHLVMGPSADGKPIHFIVRIDGKEPAANHGVDTQPNGMGLVTEQRLYQLIRQSGPVGEHIFDIEFFDPGVEAFSFTFG